MDAPCSSGSSAAPRLKVLLLASSISLLMLVWVGWHVHATYRVGRDLARDYSEFEHRRTSLANLDHELRTTAQMAVMAIDVVHWRQAYDQLHDELAQILNSEWPGVHHETLDPILEAARVHRALLSRFESRAFDAVAAGQRLEAETILENPRYAAAQNSTHQAIDALAVAQETYVFSRLRSAYRQEMLSLSVAFVIFIISFGTWLFLFHRLRDKQRAWLAELHSRRAAESELEAAVTKYRDLFEHANDSIFIIDKSSHRLLDVNQNAAVSLGYPRDELLSLRIEDLDLALPPLSPGDPPLPLHDGDSATFSRTFITRSGEECQVSVSSQLIEFDHRPAYQYAARDVTACHTLERQLRQSQRMESMGQIASGIAHEFSNLAMTISSYNALVRAQLPACPASVGTTLEKIDEVAAEARRTAKALMTFSGKSSVELRPADVRHILRRSGQLLRKTLPTSITLEAGNLQVGPVWVRADATQLEQVIFSLAINARDAMPEGGTLSISCATRSACGQSSGVATRAAELVDIIVSDTGTGMDPETLTRIWEPFFTTKPTTRASGMGLSIVHGIVTSWGGEIDVRTELDVGTTFTITLPRIDEMSTKDHRPTTAEIEHIGEGELVVVVWPDNYIGELLTTTLLRAGYSVLSCSSCDELLERYEQHQDRLRLLLVDQRVASQSDCDWLGRIRLQNPDLPAIVVVERFDASWESDLHNQAVILERPFDMMDLKILAANLLQANAEVHLS